jgi:hypothetical protein
VVLHHGKQEHIAFAALKLGPSTHGFDDGVNVEPTPFDVHVQLVVVHSRLQVVVVQVRVVLHDVAALPSGVEVIVHEGGPSGTPASGVGPGPADPDFAR